MVPAWAAPFIGIPFLAHGRTRAGVDCYGLVYLVMLEVFGLVLNEWAGLCELSAPSPEIGRVIQAGQSLDNWTEVRSAPRLGDVLIFRENGHPSHIGLIVDPVAGLMLHAMPGIGASIHSYRSPLWQPRICYRVRHPKFDASTPRIPRP